MSEPRLLTRDFWLLVVGHFLQALGYSSLLLLPLYLDHLGASRTEIGAIMGLGAISALLSKPLVGWALDAWGRKPTLYLGTVLLIAGMLGMGLVKDIGVWVYADRLLINLGIGALFTAYFTFVSDIIPPARRTEGLAIFGISGLLPLLVNPLSAQLAIAPADLRWFLPVIGLVIAPSLIAIAMLPEPRREQDMGQPLRRADVTHALRQQSLWPVWLATAFFSGLVAVFMAFVTVSAEARGIEQPANLWLTYALGASGVRLIGSRLPDILGPSRLVPPSVGIYVAGLLVAAEAQTATGFYIAGALAGIGHGYGFPVLSAQVVNRMPGRLRGSGMAMFTALWGLSELLASPVMGAIADAYGDRTMFIAAALGALFFLGIWALLERRFGRRIAAPQVATVSEKPSSS